MSLPRMSLHVGDYLKDTTHLDATMHGAYLLLIMHYWAKGSLPDDDVQLAMIARMSLTRWRKARPILQAFFYDGWRHKRVERESAEAIERYEKYARAGRASAQVRAAKKSEHRSKDVCTTMGTKDLNRSNNREPITKKGRGIARPRAHSRIRCLPRKRSNWRVPIAKPLASTPTIRSGSACCIQRSFGSRAATTAQPFWRSALRSRRGTLNR